MNDSDITSYNIEYLLEKFKPLILSIYTKYKDIMHTQEDKEELMEYIKFQFITLACEYNPNRGVGFSYYIKKMLTLKMKHYIAVCIEKYNNECYVEDEILIEDVEYNDLIEKIIHLHSMNPDIVFGKKHRDLMVNLIIKHMTLKEIAEEEGVNIDRIHARLFFLKKKLDAEGVIKE